MPVSIFGLSLPVNAQKAPVHVGGGYGRGKQA